MLRLIAALLLLIPTLASAQGFGFGPGTTGKIQGANLPACTSTMSTDYIIIDPVSATTCGGGGTPNYADMNFCVCDKNTLNFVVLYSTLQAAGAVDSVFGRTGIVIAQPNDYTVSQVTGAIAASTLASTTSGQGSTLIGFNNSASGLSAIDVQAAIDEIDGIVDGLESAPYVTSAADPNLTNETVLDNIAALNSLIGSAIPGTAHTIDTNAQTICANGTLESLRGDGTCVVPQSNIADNAITEPKLDVTNEPGAPENGYALTWDDGTGRMTWESVGGSSALDDLITTANCGTPAANEVLITASSGVHRITSGAGCVVNDTIIIPDLSTFSPSETLLLSIINDSGVDLLIDASANSSVTNEASSDVVPAGATISVVQTAASTVHIIGTGVSSGSTPFDACRSGSRRGGGLDASTGFYEWTCGNYNWSALVGGIDGNGVTDYNTPTTVGGSAWTMTCTGDGTADVGTAAEKSACLTSGETIRMYAMADIMLAQDNTVVGGIVYLPSGVYADGYCGQSSSQVANGCPVLRDEDWHETRKIGMYRASLIGEGNDSNGPHQGGRTGTWLLSDHGSDANGNGNLFDDVVDPGGSSGHKTDHWAFRQGTQTKEPKCAWDLGDTGCDVANAVSVLSDVPVSYAVTGGSSTRILEDFKVEQRQDFQSGEIDICIDNRIPSTGVCTGDLRVECDTNTGGRTGPFTGECPVGLGTCVGYADALEVWFDAYVAEYGRQPLVLIKGNPQARYGEFLEGNPTTTAYVGRVGDFAGTSCATGDGKFIRMSDWADPLNEKHMFYPFGLAEYLLAEQLGTFSALDMSRWYQSNIWYKDISFMPAAWVGRDSPTATADCLTDDGGLPCDEVDLLALGTGWGGGFDSITTWYGGGGATSYAFSLVDGDASAMKKELKNSQIMFGRGQATDASSFLFTNNLWEGWSAPGQTLIKISFNDNSIIRGDTFIGNTADAIFQQQNSSNATIRDITLINNSPARAMFRISGSRRANYTGITGYGNTGLIVMVDPTNDDDIFDVVFKDVFLSSHAFAQVTADKLHSLIARTDFNNNAGLITGRVEGWVKFENWFVTVHADAAFCGVWFGGMTGDDSDTVNGLSRTVDDDRNHLIFDTFAIESAGDCTDISPADSVCDVDLVTVVGETMGEFFCFGNKESGSAQLDDANILKNWKTIVGPIPAWKNYRIGNKRAPDNEWASMTSEEAGDCEDLMLGTIVRVHDADIIGDCEDSDNDGVMDPEATDDAGLTAVCKCDPTGNSGSGLWSAL